MSADTITVTHPSLDPRTATLRRHVAVSTPEQVGAKLAAAAAGAASVAAAAPTKRAAWLYAVADALTDPETADGLVALADEETALGQERLRGELARTAAQMRFYAEVAVEGSYLSATIDTANASRSSLARVQVPLGPVAVFGASNFPFAFGVLGNDTASAIAAGCPVVAKAHPAHPELSVRLAKVALEALVRADASDGVFGLVSGWDSGLALVRAPQTAAIGFTGSQRGGMALWRAANERDVVIPVFAEMGTVNPVVVTRAAVTRVDEIAAGLVGSFTLSNGQFCTKPGLVLAPLGSGLTQAATQALQAAPATGWYLTDAIAAAAESGVAELVAAGARVASHRENPSGGWAASPVMLTAEPQSLTRGSRLLEECFGPVVIICEYETSEELEAALRELQGALAASIMSAGVGDLEVADLLNRLTPLVGRVAVDEWPTGVAWTWAQQHGGPWPATSVPAATSVGAAALGRFTRPVAYQNAPDHALPPALRADNPWGISRRVDGQIVLRSDMDVQA